MPLDDYPEFPASRPWEAEEQPPAPVGVVPDSEEPVLDNRMREILLEFADAYDIIVGEDGSQNQHRAHMSGATFDGTESYWIEHLAEAKETVGGLPPHLVAWEDKIWVEITNALSKRKWTERRVRLLRTAGVIMAEILDGDAHPEKAPTKEEQAQINAAEALAAPEHQERPLLTQVSNDDGEHVEQ